MKKNFLFLFSLFTLLVIFSGTPFLKAQDYEFYLIPPSQTVSTSADVSVSVVFGNRNDTVNADRNPLGVTNWLVDGKPSLDLISIGPRATYHVPSEVPQKNPIAISCNVIGDNGKEQITLVANIFVQDNDNQVVINGTTFVLESGTNLITKDKVSASNLRAMVTSAGTVLVLEMPDIQLTLVVPGTAPGTYPWDYTCMVSGQHNLQAFASFDPANHKATNGSTTITEYGEAGKKIKGTFEGSINDYGRMVPISGRFSVVHTN